MSALLSGLTDRNSVVQKSFAFAMGHLVRVSRGLRWFYPLVCLCAGLFVLVCVFFKCLSGLSLFSVTDFSGQ